jgi:hypothetical protein
LDIRRTAIGTTTPEINERGINGLRPFRVDRRVQADNSSGRYSFKARTAASVPGPKDPSAAPGLNPAA